MSDLTTAIRLAAKLHDKQTDKGDNPYILHPLRVMLHMNTDEERIVAVLHDVLEDCDIEISELYRLGYSDRVVQAIKTLTRGETESYFEFIDRVNENEFTRKVKLADIQDNMDLSRISNEKITETDIKRTEKYKKALEILISKR